MAALDDLRVLLAEISDLGRARALLSWDEWTRMTTRHWEKARRVSAELRAEITRETSIAEHAWEEARRASDFRAFLPHLERVTSLARRYLECFEFDHPYDPLLDDYEPGM